MAYNPVQWDQLSLENDPLYAMLQRPAATMPDGLTLDPTRFPAPAVDNPTPPASDDSSPSPPSIKEREQFAASRPSTRRSTALHEDDGAKRKQDDISDSDDSSYEHPYKHQHRSSEGAGPRRSTGGTKKKGGPDENRAAKRKEQNRAAQRAFRERKERHVKELEDQLNASEARAQNQERENENLRDLLGRLQNENLLLKQSAFTFSFPPSSTNAQASTTNAAHPGLGNRNGSSPNLPSPPSGSSNASTPETSDNSNNSLPQSALFAGRPHANSSASRMSSGGVANPSASSPSGSEATTSRFLSSPGAFGLGTPQLTSGSASNEFGSFDFGFANDMAFGTGAAGGKGSAGGIQTIASNPMFMSFGDPVMDPMAWASFGPGDYTNGAQGDIGILGASMFGDNTAVAVNPAAGFNNSRSDSTDSGNFNSVDEIFASGNGSGITPSFLDYGAVPNLPGPGSVTASSTTGSGGTFSSASAPSEVGTAVTSNPGAGHSDDTCPKTVEDVQRIQKNMTPSTFGPPVSVRSPVSSPGASSPPPAATTKKDDEKEAACAHARMAALCADLPRTTKKPNQIEIGRAWEKIRQHQGFEECDIDELCNELSAKARCDGSRPVLEESSFNNIVRNLGKSMHKRNATGPCASMAPGAAATAA